MLPAMSLQSFLTFLVLGALAGWISGLICKGKGFGLVGNMIVGIVGAFLGGFVFGLLGISAHNFLGQLIFAVLGALLFLWLLRFIKK
ncbi:MAG: GlsB/YeaQ/YmgE family stress response rane protein [Verrucomicrobia bacterium]|nr:GlsB/YeaQ/YmgE family stress response rane protein [Verrucomicrobiota bacterium]